MIIHAANVGFILERTASRLDLLMNGAAGQERVYHYLPFCFCASWIALLSYLSRRSLVTLNLDLAKLAGEMRAAAPDYFLNVPALLERMRKAVDEQIWKTGGIVLSIYTRAKAAWMRKQERKTRASRWNLAGARECGGVSCHSQKNAGREIAGAYQRFRASQYGNATLLCHAWDSGVAGVRADGNYRNLHHG